MTEQAPTLTSPRNSYKPFQYPWAYEFYKRQESAHWVPENISLAKDIIDWNTQVDPRFVATMSRLLRFFTQGDVDIARSYYEDIIPLYPAPEMRMMFGKFAATEALHVDAYSILIDQLGLPETDYGIFMQIKAMRAKHEYLEDLKVDPKSARSRALKLAVHGAFGEGLHLFGTFVCLLNEPRQGRMMGVGQTVTYSIKDESIHILGNIRTYKQEIEENPEIFDAAFKECIYQAGRDMVQLEFDFIDACFIDGDLETLSAADVKLFILHLANKRCDQLGLDPLYHDLAPNPLGWFSNLLSDVELANVFETNVTEYAAGRMTGSWDNAWKVLANLSTG